MIEIVPFDISHIDEIYEIENSSFSIPWSKQIFYEMSEVPWIRFYTAIENDNNVIGYGGLNHILDEGQIINIAVHPDYRQMGIGDMLMHKMIDYAENNDIAVLTLEVRESNIIARKLYEKYGFRKVGIRKKYYTHPNEDAVLMNKNI